MYHLRALLRGGKAAAATSSPPFARSLLQFISRFLQTLSIAGPPSSPRHVPSSVQSSEPTLADLTTTTSSKDQEGQKMEEGLLQKLQNDLSAPWENDRGKDAWIQADWYFLDNFPVLPNAPVASCTAQSKQAVKAAKAYQGYKEFLASNPGVVLPSSGRVTKEGKGGNQEGAAVGGPSPSGPVPMPVEEGETMQEGYGARLRGLDSSLEEGLIAQEQYDAEISLILAKLREQEAAASTPYPNYYTEFFTSKAGLALRDAAVKGLPDPYFSEEGGGEMTEQEQQAYLNFVVAMWKMHEAEPSTPYPVYYEGRHDASTPYPHVPFYWDELERQSSTYNHMMGYDNTKRVCPEGLAPLILYLDSGSTGANEDCREADGKAAFYFTALAGGKSARTLTLPITTTPTTVTTTTDTTLEPDLPDISAIGTDFALLQILDLGCQPPSNVLTVELRNELMPDVVCSRWTVPGWAETLYHVGTSVTKGDKEGGVKRRTEEVVEWRFPYGELNPPSLVGGGGGEEGEGRVERRLVRTRRGLHGETTSP